MLETTVPGRLRKRLSRYFVVSWREQPTRYDIEALQANIARVGLVIRVRWLLILVLVVYSLLGGALYATRMPLIELAHRMAIPALALGFVVLYNTFYALNYKRLGNIAVWNNLQLLLDALVVTVLLYFSGGANSWFWSMYSLFILEATFILPRSRSAWLIALACIGMLGTVEWFELLGWIPHLDIPFAADDFYKDVIFVSIRFAWQAAVILGTASVSVLLVGEVRKQLAAKSSQTIIDVTTGLYSRGYFMRAFPAELNRSERDQRPIHLMLLDIDNFNDYNIRFGLDNGDRLLKALAGAINATVALAGDLITTTNIAARIGGEEFAILISEDQRTGVPPTRDDALLLAEQLRSVCEAVRVEDAGVTVSIGFASAPEDGTTADDLMDAADNALVKAIELGGNRIVCSSECGHEVAEKSPLEALED